MGYQLISCWHGVGLSLHDSFIQNIRQKEGNFYLTMHSTQFIYSYMALDISLRTTQIVRKEAHCHHYMGYSFGLAIRVLLYAPSHSTYHGLCYTNCGALAGMRNSSMGQWGEQNTLSVNKYSEAWKVQITMGHQHVSSWHGVRSSLHAKQAAVFRRQGADSPLIQLNLAKPDQLAIQLGFFNVHIQNKLLQHTPVMSTHLSWAHTPVISRVVCLWQKVSS